MNTVWIDTLTDEVWAWIQRVFVNGHPGWIRYCTDGALFEPGRRAGLGLSCLALKLLYMLDLLDRLKEGELEGWIAHIKSFQRKSGKAAGYFEDPAILRFCDRRAGLFRKDWAVRRAETRQALAALLCLDIKSERPIRSISKTPDSIRSFVHRLPWNNPWAAGSHVSHLMSFLHLNSQFEDRSNCKELLLVVLEELDAFQDPVTGCWFKGSPSAAQMINGAMKVLTGYAFIGSAFPRPDRLIDFALGLSNDRDACHHADLIYVLHQCTRLTDHRIKEVKEVARARLDEIERFRKADGGFSFRVEGSGLHYYGVPMSKGLPVSDIHGSTLFVWAIVMIADILGWRDKLGWNLPVT